MENAEEVMHSLEEFSKLKPKDIPRELDDYLGYVAKTGDPVFKWSIIKCLFREKLLNVITDFYESTLTIELPPCPNVDAFNYERMKASLLEKLDSFHGAPFTVQRISELLTNPRKEYNRADKFMRAIEKNILVVSVREPGRYSELDGDNQSDPTFNGIPEQNDSGIETTFTCNDLADPDSSSQVYEVVNSDNHDSSFNVNMDSNVVSEVQISVEGDNLKEEGSGSGTSSDDSQEENVVGINSATDKSENNGTDNENECVICSTGIAQSSEDHEQSKSGSVEDSSVKCESVPDISNSSSLAKNTDTSDVVEKEICIDSSSDETPLSGDIPTFSTKEVSVKHESESQVVATTEKLSSDVEEPEENISMIEDGKQLAEQKEVSSVTSGSEVIPSEEPSLTVVGDDSNRSIECDTSNAFDSDCVGDFENTEKEKPPEENLNPSEDNEVSSCVDNLEEKNVEATNDDSPRETSVIHTTSTPDYNETMEVEECQITVADQSEH